MAKFPKEALEAINKFLPSKNSTAKRLTEL